MKVLLIEDKPESRGLFTPILHETFRLDFTETTSLQGAIELLELKREPIDLIICDYHGGSLALLGCLLQVSSQIPCIVFIEDVKLVSELFLIPREALLETLNRGDAVASLKGSLKRLSDGGFFNANHDPDADFIRVKTKQLVLFKPLPADIYIRLAPNRYCKRFRAEDGFDRADLEQHFLKKGIDSFYLHKDQAAVLVANQEGSLDLMLQGQSSAEAERQTVDSSLSIIHDVVDRMGFTKQIQELVKKTVALMLKTLGSSPKLCDILSRLRQHEGKYITSHSIMLGEVACAIAYRIGWSSATVFLKLTMAAFLHDLTLRDNRLARAQTIAELQALPNLGPEQIQAFKLHPVTAAEYSRKFDEILPDVDTVLMQHHEQPNGTGFPRGLYHNQISPLACIFIIAHELLDFFLELVPTNSRGAMMEFFLKENEKRFSEGTFRKICESLKKGTPLNS